MIEPRCVLLLKSQTSEAGEDKYEKILLSNNLKVKQVKTLIFNYKNIEGLRDELQASEKYSGLILSSPRCVQGVCLASNNSNIMEKWRTKDNFAVGEATYRDAMEKLSLECLGREAGNALNLSKIILENKQNYTKPFLFPHGNLKTDTLNLELQKDGLTIQGVEIYETIANPNIETDIAKATDQFQTIPEYVVFFSPSGFNSSIEFIKRIHVDLKQLKFIAIGPVTETAILENNFPVFGVAKRPNPEEVLNAILSR